MPCLRMQSRLGIFLFTVSIAGVGGGDRGGDRGDDRGGDVGCCKRETRRRNNHVGGSEMAEQLTYEDLLMVKFGD